MSKYIDAEKLVNIFNTKGDMATGTPKAVFYNAAKIVEALPASDVVEIVRCQNCMHSVPLDRNSELNSCFYMHCTIERGEEVRNVWHKYKKYYKDYSVVDRNGFCDSGERKTDD